MPMDIRIDHHRFTLLSGFVREECQRRLRAYEAQPRDATEHFETENEVLSGGYAYRQLYELVQNAADAILESGEGKGRVHVRLTASRLEAANTGAALDEDGIVALLNARSSSKRGNQIGRFGVGFKSLLKLGGRVDLVSRSIGLRFDPAACRDRIRRHLGLSADARAPGMRLADVLDPNGANSPLLSGNAYDWATTVVTAKINDASAFPRLAKEMAAFPSEFLLFLPAEIELDLEVEGGARRRISKRIENDIAYVGDGTAETRWKLFETFVSIQSAEARNDAMPTQARDEVPLAWAVPIDGREQAGRFWAFFPTETHSLTSGILNAPWKLNSDRTNLIRGPWNEAIMDAAAGLIADSLPALATPEDCGLPVSAFPRQPERQDEIAVPLVRAVWDRIVKSGVLPNVDGVMREPSELTRHFVEETDICEEWAALADAKARSEYLHPDCYRLKTRTSRINFLETEAKRRDAPVLAKSTAKEWIESIAREDFASAKRVLAFVGRLLKDGFKYGIYSMPDAHLIPTTHGTLAAPSGAVITDGRMAPAGFLAVADEVARDQLCKKILVGQMGVKELTEDSWEELLEASLDTARASNNPEDWENFWRNISAAPNNALSALLKYIDTDRLRFRSVAGSWANRNLLVVTEQNTTTPTDLRLDLDFLRGLGVELPEELLSEFPVGDETEDRHCAEMKEYLQWVGPAFDNICRERVGSTPQYLPGFLGSTVRLPAGWRLLPLLPPATAARLTATLLKRVTEGATNAQPVRIVHPTRENAYPKLSAPHPFYYWLTKQGRVRVGGLVFPIRAIDPEVANALAEAEVPGFGLVADFFQARGEGTDLGPYLAWNRSAINQSSAEKFWNAVFIQLERRKSAFGKLRDLWEDAHACGAIPMQVPTSDGPVPLREIYVTTDSSVGHDLDDGHIVLLSEDVAADWISAGAQSLATGAILSFRARLTEPSHLLDLFPELAAASELADQLDHLSAVWVEGLEEHLGPKRREITVAMDPDGAILLDQPRFKTCGWTDGIGALLRCLARHGLVPSGEAFDGLLTTVLDRRTDEARNTVRSEPTLEGRLLKAVGGDVGALLGILTPATRQAIRDSVGPDDVARLALAVHGPAVLSRLRDVLEAQGLAPPKRWGGEPARTFVLDLGFPLEFASAVGGRRESEISVSGPISLPPLHDYQEEILNDVGKLLSTGTGRRRAVISLPTGGGKTRVAGEAAVRLVLRGDGRRSVLWVAQTDELCEQAVQCFRQLWVNIGEPGEDLRIVRLWGGQRNPAPSEGDEAVVVIASIQTINSRSGRSELAWIREAGIVVIDECHHSITGSYTDLLRWLNVQVGSERAREREAPVLGLSATPWRGYNEEESERLAGRFDRRWFPADQAGLHNKLSAMGVLAERSYGPLHYDLPVMLSEREQQHVDTFGELPDSVVDRIGEDDQRNDLIVRAVLRSSAGSILLFANSVSHAQYLAARLHLEGCPAAAVSGQTDRLARQHFTRRFRSGELRVICNHSVLTTGFDAPKADMILISRPVFSPVLYMQMVGRGLRGPANGGTTHCEIVTVEDNIVNYRDRLAYHFCRRFFDS